MAQTYANNDNVLSKVKFGNTTYYMKDAAARAILDTFGSAATYSVAYAIADNGTGLVTADQVYDFVNHQKYINTMYMARRLVGMSMPLARM